MSFILTEEQEELLALVRKFSEKRFCHMPIRWMWKPILFRD